MYPLPVNFRSLLWLIAGLMGFGGRAEVFVTSGHPSWTPFNRLGSSTAVVDIRLKPGTSPANAVFAVETLPPSGAFQLSTTRLALSKVGTARLSVVSTGVTNLLIRLRELTAGGQTLSASLNFYGPLSMAPSHTILHGDQVLNPGIAGGVPPYVLKATPDDLLTFLPDGTAIPRGSKSGPVSLIVTDSKKKTASAQVIVKLPTRLSLDASKWTIRSAVALLRPSPLTNSAGWFFDFPTVASGRSVGYVTQNVGFSYIQARAIEARFTILTEGPVVFDHRTETFNTSDYPAHLRLLIQKGSISLDPNGRWWSNPLAVKLEAGSFVFRVPLDPDQWSNVAGQMGDADDAARAAFAKALANPSEIGFTLGGGFFFGHGDRVSGGPARFVFTGFEWLP